MGRRNARYNLEQLVEILEKQNPGLLARLAPEKAFTFREQPQKALAETLETTKPKAQFKLHIGQKSSNEVWLSYIGPSKPWLSYHSGRRYYGTTDFENVSLISPFDFLKPSRSSLYPWDDFMKAFAPFLFLRAGHVDEWVNFGGGKGLPIFIAALELLPVPAALRKSLAGKTSVGETSMGGSPADTDSETDREEPDANIDEAKKGSEIDETDSDMDSDAGEDLQDNQSDVFSTNQEKISTKDQSAVLSSTDPVEGRKRSRVEYLDGEMDEVSSSKTQKV